MENKLNIKTILISFLGSVIISIILSLIIVNVTKTKNNKIDIDDFKIESFSIDSDKEDFSYSDETHYTYIGNGEIECSDKNNDYLLLIKQYEENNDETTYTTSIIHNGKGEISTYDYEYTSGKSKKPNYSFKIIGFLTFND